MSRQLFQTQGDYLYSRPSMPAGQSEQRPGLWAWRLRQPWPGRRRKAFARHEGQSSSALTSGALPCRDSSGDRTRRMSPMLQAYRSRLSRCCSERSQVCKTHGAQRDTTAGKGSRAQHGPELREGWQLHHRKRCEIFSPPSSLGFTATIARGLTTLLRSCTSLLGLTVPRRSGTSGMWNCPIWSGRPPS